MYANGLFTESIHKCQSYVDNEEIKMEILDTAGQVKLIFCLLSMMVHYNTVWGPLPNRAITNYHV